MKLHRVLPSCSRSRRARSCTEQGVRSPAQGSSVTQVTEPSDAIDQKLMVALSQAKNFHHKAKVYMSDGNTAAAIASVREILSLRFPAECSRGRGRAQRRARVARPLARRPRPARGSDERRAAKASARRRARASSPRTSTRSRARSTRRARRRSTPIRRRRTKAIDERHAAIECVRHVEQDRQEAAGSAAGEPVKALLVASVDRAGRRDRVRRPQQTSHRRIGQAQRDHRAVGADPRSGATRRTWISTRRRARSIQIRVQERQGCRARVRRQPQGARRAATTICVLADDICDNAEAICDDRRRARQGRRLRAGQVHRREGVVSRGEAEVLRL